MYKMGHKYVSNCKFVCEPPRAYRAKKHMCDYNRHRCMNFPFD